MDNLIVSLQVVSPVFLMMLLGCFLRVTHILEGKGVTMINRLCFRALIPILLFHNVYTTDLGVAFDGSLLLYGLGSVLLLFVLLMVIIARIEKDPAKRGVLVQGCMRSNFVLFGLPMVSNLCGDEQIGTTCLLIAVIVPLFNLFSVIALETWRGGKINGKAILKGIATNPLIIGSLLGVIMALSGLKLPGILEKTIQDVGGIATPLALLALGASFSFRRVKGYVRQILIGVIGKLVVVPLLFLPPAIALGFRNIELASLLVMYGAPAAVASFAMTQEMDGDVDLAGQLIVFGSAAAILTIFLWIYLLKTLQFIA